MVYWIHHVDHTDMFTQGYIGVTKSIKRRFEEHKNRPSNAHLKNAINKYGWDSLVKEVLIIADEAYCLAIELKLRANDKMGWNLIVGGGMPPSSCGKKFIRSEEWKRKQSEAKKGKVAWNKGLKLSDNQKDNMFNLAEYMKDKPHSMLGKKHSQETIEKIRQSKKMKKEHQ